MPQPLAANSGWSFQGSVVVGTGFIVTTDEARALVHSNPRNREVLYPYLTGKDLNSRPDQSASRWVINFFDWSLDKAEQYREPMAIVREKVYPVRMGVNREAHRKYWWHYGDKRPALYRKIAQLRRVLVVAQTSRTLAFAFVPNGMVYAMMTIVFAYEDACALALLQSGIHDVWARKYASTMKQDLRYTPTDVFDTFPFPVLSPLRKGLLDVVGERYDALRSEIMARRSEGLTSTYNRFHDSNQHSADISGLRALHIELDETVAAAYGWSDLNLGHGFHADRTGCPFHHQRGSAARSAGQAARTKPPAGTPRKPQQACMRRARRRKEQELATPLTNLI